ncbi:MULTISPECIES: chondroitinase family polysaccharide lyase [Streptomyces]|uniref:Chondroitin-sulfate-ABC endolyase/exolyase n=1 Tax=Streptomyces clavifer TaxID=68188 RepID=A0ABS4VJI7_9ACTN|nr:MULTISPECIES: chondroitinase family polysaccharide lyase [Streptomyces]MBP2364085.1 chondroitin-sulfate-ABC endolyase/exolyase [Streptomyces clavifer]MDX2744487.1 chondroitinase family polysaccharide lyase [Streptomyces sp. NRRL_B-2557]WUC31491.1 chondroitinase family polysaccharide lyase [Streptomyces clavifer]GHB10396.1 chondroitin sulfate ABC exolyase [Streptomyces clavifer]
MDALPALPVSRRRLLAYGVAATGAVALPFVAVPAAGATTAPPFTELEERALALRPPAFLLESAVPRQITASPGTRLGISGVRSVCGTHALRWDHGPRSVITVDAEPAWAADPYEPRPLADQAWQGTVDTFSVWIYNEAPADPDDVVRFEFGRGSRTDCWFEFRLDFTGWRTAWVRYAYDMHGRPHPAMDTVRIIAPRRPGTLWIDQLLLNVALRPDAPTRDAQVPEICVEGDDWDQQHWQALYLFDRILTRTTIPTPAPSTAEADALGVLKTRYHTDYLAAAPKVDDAYVATLTGQADAVLTGRPVFSYQSQIYPPEISADLKSFVGAVTLRTVTDLMQKIAQAHDAGGTAYRPALGSLYVRLVERLREQGWTYGSCLGTIHHVGYDIRGYYDSVYLMRQVLAAAGLFEAVRTDLTWLTGFGRIFRGFDHRNAHGSTSDIINTTVRGKLAVALLQDGEARQIAYLKALRDWLSTYLLPTTGIQDGVKTDGTTFHHVGFFPDYARDGFVGLAPLVYVLSGGPFRISTEAHESLKQAVLTLRVVANTHHWPVSLSGRNPGGTTGLVISPFQWLTVAGTPDASRDLDPELGAAFLRLLPAAPTTAQKKIAARLAAEGVSAESAPSGAWAYNYAALAVQRRDAWQVTVRGHNRYLWSTEIYDGSNWYGRYNTYGQIQVLHRGTPVTNLDSGYSHDGYDWNRRPGTTTLHKPWARLKGDLTGTIEEVLLTDERFAGAHTIEGRNGMFAMRLREHPKYEGSHRARTSVFLFDNLVVALGTGIENSDRQHETETTLFQTRLAATSAPTLVDGEPVTSFPYALTDQELTSARWLLDDKGLGYYLPPGQRLALTRSTQLSRHHGTDAETRGDFATAWLRHGTAPRDASYTYAMLVGATAEAMEDFTEAMSDGARAPYTVERADTLAHIVTDRATGITGYAVFDPTAALAGSGPVRAVDTPCMLLLRTPSGPAGEQSLVLSVCDPDLRLYEGRDHAQYDGHEYTGHYSPFSRPWLADPSSPHTLHVTLDGRWHPAASDQPCTTRIRGGRTVVAFRTVDGRPVECRLTRETR